MQARHPGLYPDILCCLCRGPPEDNNHGWVSPESFKQQKLIWEEAVALIPKWGRAAIKKANEDALSRYTPHRLTRGYDSLKPHARSWSRLHTSLSAIRTRTPLLDSGRSVTRAQLLGRKNVASAPRRNDKHSAASHGASSPARSCLFLCALPTSHFFSLHPPPLRTCS